MRIISGTARRREIRVPKDVARPSTDRLREALFSILNQRVEGARVLDLFAGSGALGLECLSRGASSCAFVDASRESARVIKQNLTNTKLAGGHVSHADVFKHLSSA
ncbi:MAG: RsmD family RNA methyltransferase, partial [Akkermansiaceae bacterium]